MRLAFASLEWLAVQRACSLIFAFKPVDFQHIIVDKEQFCEALIVNQGGCFMAAFRYDHCI